MKIRKRRQTHRMDAIWDAEEALINSKIKKMGGAGFRHDEDNREQLRRIFTDAFRQDGDLRALGVREDSGYYFARETEAVQAAINMVENAESPAANGTLFPIDTFGGAWAKSVVQREHEGVGKARVGGHAAQDAPMVDVIAREEQRAVVPVDAAYGFDVKDIALGEATGQPLDRSRAFAAREAIDEEIDAIAAVGHAAITGGGVVNETAVPSTTLPNGNWIAADAAVDDVIADISLMMSESNEDTDGRSKLDHIAVPPAYDMWLMAKRLGDNEGNLKTYVENVLGITIVGWHRLKDAGASGQDIMFGYKRSPDVIKLALPVPFTQLPPQAKARAFVVNCYAETAGLILDKPLYTRRSFLTDS